MTKSIIIIMLLIQAQCLSQHLKLEPYQFVSQAGDTVQAEKGAFKVLEDRRHGYSDSISLQFIRFKSTNPNPASPIVYLSGGPGGSGSETAKGKRFELFMKLREVADVVAFDQRGTGLSHRLQPCPFSSEFEVAVPLKKAIYVEKTVETAQKCITYWNDTFNLAAYNTMESADDLDDLRQVLGVDSISLWGTSYGSHLAFEYIRRYESNVERAVLSSLEGPNETIKLPKNTEDFVFKIATLAQHKYPDLIDKIKIVHERLKFNPVTAPYTTRDGTIDTVGISNFELQAAIATFYLKNPNNSKQLPKLYAALYEGDFSMIAENVMIMKRYVFKRINTMSFAMDMQSGISPERKLEVASQIDTAILGSTINFLMYEWRDALNFNQLPATFRTIDSNTVRALLLSGSLDGRTYLSSAQDIAKKFKKSHHVIVENAGHDLFMASDAVGDLILDFLRGKTITETKILLDPILFD
ncbi:MAG: alpha/beta fold hydrolase [Psychroserpens sp.]|uniref:alpha/beta hydrolase n=1 Tax=Psychroserpens sp. TaxID=2020870 RepID=UPI003C782A5C